MKQETYQYFSKKINDIPWGLPAVKIAGKCLTYGTALIYMAVLADLFFGKEYGKCLVLCLVPMISFMAVSIFRAWYNQKRPYEIYDIRPLIPKDTKGKSFPSRHIFSIYVIGAGVCAVYPVWGYMICVMGIFLAVIRVVTGVHFPKDVIAGAVIGVLAGSLVKVVLVLM